MFEIVVNCIGAAVVIGGVMAVIILWREMVSSPETKAEPPAYFQHSQFRKPRRPSRLVTPYSKDGNVITVEFKQRAKDKS